MPNRLLVAALAALVALAGCRAKRKVYVPATEEEGPTLSSMVHVADPRAAGQLVSGFYPVEENSWRWTAGRFVVLLRPPRGAAQKGALLELKFSVPDPVIARLKSVALSARIGSMVLAPEKYAQAGEFTYTREVPADLLDADSVKVEFTLDKVLPPGDVDQRELGVVVSSIGFQPK